jgi:hypothetical protein
MTVVSADEITRMQSNTEVGAFWIKNDDAVPELRRCAS